MLTGKRFELRSSTVALETVDAARVAVTVPEGAVILIRAGPVGIDRMVDVLWENRALMMFALDLRENGVEIEERKSNPTRPGTQS